MFFRKSYIASRETLNDSGEKTWDVGVTDPITMFWVEIRNTNGATSNIDNWVAECVSSIEVIDGSEVLFSLDGQEALAYGCYALGRMPYQLVEEQGGNTQNLSIPILFGRYIGDTEYSFDPKRFKNPQVRINWNFATNTAVGATGFVSGSGRATILAEIMEGAPNPRAYISAREQKTWTTASSGIEYTDLPTDYPYLAVMVGARKAATATFSTVSNLKLHGDQEKVVFFDMRMSDLIRYSSQFFGPFSYDHRLLVSDNTTVYFLIKQEEAVQFLCQNLDDVVFRYVNSAHGEGKLYMDSAGSAETTDRLVDVSVSGWCPLNFVWIPFGDMQKQDEWLKANVFKNLKLEATQGSADGTGYICIVQAKTY